MKLTQEESNKRTKKTIDYFKGHPSEIELLHGILIIAHSWEIQESIDFRMVINTIMIAHRMDELSKEARNKLLEELKTA